MKDALQERAVAFAAILFLVNLVDLIRRPGMHRRIHIAERPLVSGDLPVGMHVPLAQHEHQLLLGKFRIHHRQRHAVKRQIPCRIPGILPLVGHGDDVGVVQMRPVGIAPVQPLGRRRRLPRISVEPGIHVVGVKLLAPQHAGEGLPLHPAQIVRAAGIGQRLVEFVRFGDPVGEGAVEIVESPVAVGETQPDRFRLAGLKLHRVPGRALGADTVGVHRAGAPLHDVLVDSVLDVSAVLAAEETGEVRVVVGEEQFGRALAMEVPASFVVVLGLDARRACGAQRGSALLAVPTPGIAEPQGGQQIQRRRFRTAIGHADADANVFRIFLRVLHQDIEVAVLVEHARIHQLELGLGARPPAAVDQALVRKRRLRILVQVFHVRVGGRGIQIEVVFLDVLAVVALIAGQSEEPLLENRIAAIPQRDGEADVLVAVANAGDAVLAPAVRSGAGVVVREILPGGPVRAVIFAHRAPLPFVCSVLMTLKSPYYTRASDRGLQNRVGQAVSPAGRLFHTF